MTAYDYFTATANISNNTRVVYCCDTYNATDAIFTHTTTVKDSVDLSMELLRFVSRLDFEEQVTFDGAEYLVCLACNPSAIENFNKGVY